MSAASLRHALVIVCLVLFQGLFVTQALAQTCSAPQAITFGTPTQPTSTAPNAVGDLLIGSTVVGTYEIDIAGLYTRDDIYINSAGTTLSFLSYTGAYSLANGFYSLKITPNAGSVINAGTVKFTGKSTYTGTGLWGRAFSGYNNFSQFYVDGTNVTSVVVENDTQGGVDYLNSPLSPGSSLTFGTNYTTLDSVNSSGRKSTGPAFTLDYNFPELSSGDSSTFVFQKTNSSPDGTFANETHDFIFDATGCVVPTDPASLVTVKTRSSGSATPAEGDTVSYQITVTNQGAGQATSVSLTDSLPAGLTAATGNGTVSQGSYDSTSGLWTIGTIDAGSSATLTLTGTVDAGQAGNTIINTTTAATGAQPDPTTLGDDLTETVVVSALGIFDFQIANRKCG